MPTRRHRPRAALPLLFLPFIPLHLPACGSETSGATDSDPLPTTSGDGTGSAPAECPADLEPLASPDAYAEALAEAFCAKLAECGCAEVPATCVADRTAAYAGEHDAYIAAGNTFDPVCARRRVLATEWFACDLDSTNPCAPCDVFPGALAEGEACELILDYIDPCGPDLFCNGGTCTGSLPPVGEGETCREGDKRVAACQAGQFCDFDQGICVPIPEPGDSCRDGFCGPGAWCSTSDSATGVCQARRPGGEPCADDFQCQSLRCVDSVCSDDPKICRY